MFSFSLKSLLHCVAQFLVLVVVAGSAGLAVAQTYPLRIEHAFGVTEIPAKPERIATVAWANHEVPLALGVVPVGFAAANFGDDDGDGLLPWVKARLDELGAEAPTLFDEGDGIDFEAVAASQPDVILAAYSGLSQSDYDTLSKIAPVIAYPKSAWTTDWREMILLNSAGMGMLSEGEALIKQIEGQIADTVSQYPVLQDKTAMFITHLDPTDFSRIKFYTNKDTRVRFFHDLGLKSPEAVVEASTSGAFTGEVSVERIDAFDDVDVFVTYGTFALLDKLSVHLLTSRMPAIKRKSVVILQNDALGTAANPTPLSIGYVLESYVKQLADAAQKAE